MKTTFEKGKASQTRDEGGLFIDARVFLILSPENNSRGWWRTAQNHWASCFIWLSIRRHFFCAVQKTPNISLTCRDSGCEWNEKRRGAETSSNGPRALSISRIFKSARLAQVKLNNYEISSGTAANCRPVAPHLFLSFLAGNYRSRKSARFIIPVWPRVSFWNAKPVGPNVWLRPTKSHFHWILRERQKSEQIRRFSRKLTQKIFTRPSHSVAL